MSKERTALNTEHHQQALKFAQHFAGAAQQEWLDEVQQRQAFEQKILTQQLQRYESKRPLVRTAVFAFLTVFAVSLFYYWQTDRYENVQSGQQAFQTFQAKKAEEDSVQRNDHYIINLQNQLRGNPNDGDLWFELGQAYALSNAFESAQIALKNAQMILGDKPAVLGAMATNDYYFNKQHLTAQAKHLISLALKNDPFESASLLLLASDAFLHNDFAQAIVYWEKVLDGDNPAIDRRDIIRSIQMARQMQNASQR